MTTMQTNSNTVPVNPEKDQNARSLDLMNRMRLHGMAAAFTESLHSTTAEAMTPDNFLSWLLMGLPLGRRHTAPHTRGLVPLQGLPGRNRLHDPAWS